MGINQAFLCTFYVRCTFRKPFKSLNDTSSLKDARTFSSTALNFSRVALNVHWLKERPLNLIFLDCMVLLVYCLTGTPATRPFWKMRLKTRQEWYQVGNGDLHHHLGQMWYTVVCFYRCWILSGSFLVAAIRDQYENQGKVTVNKQINYYLKNTKLV